MGVFNGMFPIAKGKEDAARKFAADTVGARKADFAAQQARATAWFGELDRLQRFILLKLLTG